MLKDYSRHFVESLLPSPVSPLLQSDKSLDFKLDRGERVLDFVGHLTSHQAPGLVAFGQGKFLSGI